MRRAVATVWLHLLILLQTLVTALCFNLSMGGVPKARPSVVYPKFFETLPSMKGKTVVVTGASRGLGYVTAIALAQKGASLFLLNRRSARADDAQAEIAEKCSGSEPQLIECDMTDFESVRRAAATVKDATASEGIDVLCCNAGVMLQPDQASKDGYDITISTNVLSHFLLTRELMPELEKAGSLRGEARIVSMSSASGFGAPGFNAEFFKKKGGNLGGQRASYERYHQSKLANLLFASALDDKLRAKKSPIKALACHPGVCGTDMFVHAMSVMNPRANPDMSRLPSAQDGALAQLKCICDPAVLSGELYGPEMGASGLPVRQPLAPPLVLVDAQSKAQLWDACQQAVGDFVL